MVPFQGKHVKLREGVGVLTTSIRYHLCWDWHECFGLVFFRPPGASATPQCMLQVDLRGFVHQAVWVFMWSFHVHGIYISFTLWSKYMAQSPKGSLVHGFYNFYNPIHGDCAIYFYPGVYRRIDSQWNFANGYSSTWSKLSNTTQNVPKKTAVSRRGNHPSIPPFVDTCVHAICVHVSSLQVII